LRIKEISLKSLTWFGRDCDNCTSVLFITASIIIEVVDLVWKGLRQLPTSKKAALVLRIEVVDLVWKGLRPFRPWPSWPSRWPIEVVDLVWKGLRLFDVLLVQG